MNPLIAAASVIAAGLAVGLASIGPGVGQGPRIPINKKIEAPPVYKINFVAEYKRFFPPHMDKSR